MFKFGHIDMEKESNPVLWDKVSKDDFDLLMKCKNLYEQCIAYSGRNIHEVGGWEGHTRKFLVETVIPKTLKALG